MIRVVETEEFDRKCGFKGCDHPAIYKRHLESGVVLYVCETHDKYWRVDVR